MIILELWTKLASLFHNWMDLPSEIIAEPIPTTQDALLTVND